MRIARKVCKHIPQVILVLMLSKKAYIFQKNAESGMFDCYNQLEEPSNYSARITTHRYH